MPVIDHLVVIDEQRIGWAAMKPLRKSYIAHKHLVDVSKDLGDAVILCTVAHELGHVLFHLADAHGHRRGRVLLLEEPEQHLRVALQASFETVVAPPVVLLPREQLAEVLSSPDRADLCIGGLVDPASGAVVLYRGDLSSMTVPLSSFKPSGDGTKADPTRFNVTDCGQTVAFGDYEAAFDAILYESDPEYRRRLKEKRLAEDRSFGASLRRLRKQKGLTLKDFPGVDPRTIARIEKGDVDKPHKDTLIALAKALGVATGDLDQY